MASKQEDIVAQVMDLWSFVQGGSRGNWESHWQEIAERIWPSVSKKFKTNFQTEGEKRTEFLFDSTASIALNRFASILDSLLTPRNQKWHSLITSDPTLNKNRQVQLYFEEVTRILFKYRYMPTANFASQNQLHYKQLGAFGSGVMFIDSLADGPGLRYKQCHLGQCYFLENHQGIVDTVIRFFSMEARQILQQWGEERTPENVKSALEKNATRDFFIIHCVKPREDADPNRIDAEGAPFASYYVLVDGRHLLEEGGFFTFPYPSSRYEQAPDETYGRSPAMDVLPAIKTLNEQKKTILKQGHRVVDPIILTHDDGVLDTFSLTPGHIQSGGISKEGRPLVQTLPTGNLAVGKDLMDDERQVINDSFLVTLFQILVESPAMTATEVLERTKEKGILLAPTIGRQQSEYLGPTIEREIDVLNRQGLLPPQPQILQDAGAEFTVQYDSPLSRSQRAEEGAGLLRTVETALGVVNVTQDMAPLDHFNFDVILPEISAINGVPAKWMRSLEDISRIRQGRQQQLQTQQALDAAPAAAGLIKATQ